jgi:hypothetical protein
MELSYKLMFSHVFSYLCKTWVFACEHLDCGLWG